MLNLLLPLINVIGYVEGVALIFLLFHLFLLLSGLISHHTLGSYLTRASSWVYPVTTWGSTSSVWSIDISKAVVGLKGRLILLLFPVVSNNMWVAMRHCDRNVASSSTHTTLAHLSLPTVSRRTILTIRICLLDLSNLWICRSHLLIHHGRCLGLLRKCIDSPSVTSALVWSVLLNNRGHDWLLLESLGLWQCWICWIEAWLHLLLLVAYHDFRFLGLTNLLLSIFKIDRATQISGSNVTDLRVYATVGLAELSHWWCTTLPTILIPKLLHQWTCLPLIIYHTGHIACGIGTLLIPSKPTIGSISIVTSCVVIPLLPI